MTEESSLVLENEILLLLLRYRRHLLNPNNEPLAIGDIAHAVSCPLAAVTAAIEALTADYHPTPIEEVKKVDGSPRQFRITKHGIRMIEGVGAP